MDACTQCGSIRLRVISGGLFQRVLALLLNQRVVVCGRCGWQGRLRRSRGGSAAGGSRPSADASRPGGTTSGRSVDLDALDRALERDAHRKPARPGGE